MYPAPAPLADQVVVITGGSRGIGRGIVAAAATAGAHVVVLSRSAPPDTDPGVHVQTDVTDDGSLAAAREQVLTRFGRVDALVAGVGGLVAPRRPVWEYGVAEFEEVLALNLTSAFRSIAAFVPVLRAHGDGRIVAIGSDAVGSGLPHLSHYLAAKAGLVGLIRGVAADLGPDGVTANLVSPGLVITETNEASLPVAIRSAAAEKQHLGRNLVPADIAGAVVFLCSPAARMITGQVLQVNGGATPGAT